MSPHKRRCSGIFIAIYMFIPSVQAAELGRLFFTPAQRAQLEYNQRQNDNTPANTSTLTVNGIVQKHGGGRIVWINGVPQVAGKSDERTPESLPIAIHGQPQPVNVKVGQKILINPAASPQE